MAEEKAERRSVPPYIPYRTFKSFVESLKQGIPGRIDRSLMASMSGTAQAQLIAALRYLGLVTAVGLPTEKLTRLVSSEGQERQKALRDILSAAYSFLTEDGFDLQRATAKQLEEQFTKAGVSGETVRKCIAFFTLAAKEAQLPISPYVGKGRSGRSSGPRSRRSPIGSPGRLETAVADEIEPIGWLNLLLSKFPSFDPAWPDEVKSKWFDAFERLMQRGLEREGEKEPQGENAKSIGEDVQISDASPGHGFIRRRVVTRD